VVRGIAIAARLVAVFATAIAAPTGGGVPEEARGIRTPDWARLEGVLGAYDAPFAAEPPWGRATAMAFIDDRTVAVLAGDGRLRVWDRIAHVTRARVDACRFQFVPSTETQAGHNDRADVLALSADRLAAIGFVSGRVCIVDLATGRKTAEVEAGPMSGEGVVLMRIRFGSGQLVTYAGQTRTVLARVVRYVPAAGGDVRWWDPRTGRKLAEAHVGVVTEGAISPDGERFVASSDKLRLVDRSGRTLWATDDVVTRIVFATPEMLLATDGKRLFLIAARDGHVDGQLTGYWKPGPGGRHAELFTAPNGHRAITTFEDGHGVTVWDLDARREIVHRASGDFWSVPRRDFVVAPDGSTFWTPRLNAIDATSLEFVDGPSGIVQCLAVSDDGRRALTCGGFRRRSVFRVWDNVAGPELEPWPNDVNAAVAVAGTTALVHTRYDNEVRNWPDGRVRFKIPHYLWYAGSLSPDGTQLATLAWSDKTKAFVIELRDAMTGKVVWRNAKLRAENDVLAFMAGGRQLLVRTRDGQLVALDVQDGALQQRIGAIPSGRLELVDDRWALYRGEYGSLAGYDLQKGDFAWKAPATATMRVTAAIPGHAVFPLAEGGTVRLHRVATGEALPGAIDLEATEDIPFTMAAAASGSKDGPVLLVGTQRGVVLRFALRLPGPSP
jgi:WD40 repeat protein